MPIAQLYILEGRTDTQKENLISEVTDAMVRAIDAPKDRVRVIITEMPKTHFGIGGESASKVKK
ncbi:MAG: 2-hydroxymuconate tautomerase [Flavobacteriaceae bacterium]|jgi:4-oxalocrotonate tautomerase|uniref:2-hydroxymuconate tautomerase n=1 Tax=Alteromonas macleodii TaxID=28108 RepID=UPI00066AB7F8|nr:2-hydroxymuconate tautomerase [Alteromonas macleodii]MAK34614.1 2-hydroxymuconate tautomerase [Flavobacteriaceae bacterium]OUX86711.1 MAG: 2-hydroxymuconate tautomerase [Alteromonas sp. TMED35]CAI3957681.1 4-oxalocrotonate tautomerase [Alteromonas macleodii]VTP52810.1 4-oxalocrotonate tautomerase [Alteromonas macleodii]|tara:strand:+ start:26333 stop:26524 length:192 start_codon:yes stop_codon:yes gene_type:complete